MDGKHEEADLLGVVGFRSSDEYLAISPGYFDLPAMLWSFFQERVRLVSTVADEVCHKEDSLHILEFHLRPMLLKRILWWEEVKRLPHGG
jgi:hypothetical protein